MSVPPDMMGLIEAPDERQARLDALRRQQMVGTLGALSGVRGVNEAGRADLASANRGLEQENQPGARLDQALKVASLQKARRELATPQGTKDWSVMADPRGGFVRYNKRTGAVEPVAGFAPGGGTDGAPQIGKMTDVQSKAFDAARRLQQELPVLNQLLEGGYDPDVFDVQWQKNMGSDFEPVFSAMASDEGKQFFSAGREILAALLRKESGAAVTADEWQEFAPLWLPWRNDSPAQRADKIRRLNDRLVGLQAEAGPNAGEWIGYRGRTGNVPTSNYGGQPSVLQKATAGSTAGNPIELDD